MEIKVRVPGSCGELMQGTQNGIPFLVTCPVNLYTMVTVHTAKRPDHIGLGSKSQLALSRTLDYLGCETFPWQIELESELPIGKGMASSSADIAAVIIAAAAAFGETLTAAEISRLAAGIEPTDGIFFPGIARMNQMTGACLESFGEFPHLKIAAFDCGGAVDTLAFHARNDLFALNQKNEAVLAAALKKISVAPTAAEVAEAATVSAIANQSILPKNGLEEIIKTVKEYGGIGVNVAHSGTVIGILYNNDADNAIIGKVVSQISAKNPQLRFLRQLELIPGGYEIKIDR